MGYIFLDTKGRRDGKEYQGVENQKYQEGSGQLVPEM